VCVLMSSCFENDAVIHMTMHRKVIVSAYQDLVTVFASIQFLNFDFLF
jgi:hypothetical protein